MSTNTSQPTSREPPGVLPRDIDIETATVGHAYTEQEVHEDAILFGDWVVDGAWFYAPSENSFYRLTTQTAPYTFALERADRVHPTGSSTAPEAGSDAPRTYPVASVVELGAELLSGYLRGILPGTSIQTSDAVISNTGEYLLVTSVNSQISSLAELSIQTPPHDPRHTDGSAASIFTPADEQSIAQSRHDVNVLAYSVNGSRSGIMHLLPDEESATTTATPQSGDRGAVTADGGSKPGCGTQGIHPSIDEIPFFPAEDPDMVARFVPTSRHVAETFQEPNLRRYALAYMQGRVLNACAGPTDLSEWYTDGDIVRNDLHPDVESDLSVDIAELACHFPPNSFDTIVFDPPWTAYQSRMRYDGYVVHKTPDDDLPVNQINIDVRDLPFTVPGENAVGTGVGGAQLTLNDSFSETGNEQEPASDGGEPVLEDDQYIEYIEATKPKEQIGHARLAKLGFDYLLKDGGRVIQFAYTGSVMPAALDYVRLDRTAFDPTGTYKTLIGGVDQKR